MLNENWGFASKELKDNFELEYKDFYLIHFLKVIHFQWINLLAPTVSPLKY